MTRRPRRGPPPPLPPIPPRPTPAATLRILAARFVNPALAVSAVACIAVVLATRAPGPPPPPPPAEEPPSIVVTLDPKEWPAAPPTYRRVLQHYGLESDLLEPTLALNLGRRTRCPDPDAPLAATAIVRMAPLGEGRPVARDEAFFARIVMAAFTQRRKTLRNAVRGLVAEDAFARAGIDPGRRGETLSVAEFRALADSA